MPPSVLNAIVDRTARATEVTSRGVVTYTCDVRTTDGGMFDENTFFSTTCSDGGPSPVLQHVPNRLCLMYGWLFA